MNRFVHSWGLLLMTGAVLAGCGSSAAQREQQALDHNLKYTQRLLMQQDTTIQMLLEMMKTQGGGSPRFPARAPVDWHDAAPPRKD